MSHSSRARRTYMYSIDGYCLLDKMNRLIKVHHPREHCNSYQLTVSHLIHNHSYSFSPSLKQNFLKSIPIRHKVCHFVPISKQEYKILLTLYTELKAKYTPKNERVKVR